MEALISRFGLSKKLFAAKEMLAKLMSAQTHHNSRTIDYNVVDVVCQHRRTTIPEL